MILSSPYEVIQFDLPLISPIVASALDLGLGGASTTSAATWALDALEDWRRRLPEALLEDLFRDSGILPKLAAFLDFDERSAVAKKGRAGAAAALKQRQKNRYDK